MGHILPFLRVRHWYYFLSLPLLSLNIDKLNPWATGTSLAIAFFCLGFAYGLNNLRDTGLDRDPAKNPLISKTLPIKSPRVYSVVLGVFAGLAITLAIFRGPLVMGAVIIQLIGSVVYSTGVRLKKIPVVGTLMNLTIFVPLCFLGGDWSQLTGSFFHLTILFSLLLVQNQLIHEVEDYREDRAQKIITTAVKLGRARTLRVSALFGVPVAVTVGHLALRWARFELLAAAIPLVVFYIWWLYRSPFPGKYISALRSSHRLSSGLCGGALWWLCHGWLSP